MLCHKVEFLISSYLDQKFTHYSVPIAIICSFFALVDLLIHGIQIRLILVILAIMLIFQLGNFCTIWRVSLQKKLSRIL